MLRRTAIVAFALGATMLTACRQQVLVVPEHSIDGVTVAEMKKCILTAVVRRGWTVVKQEPGLVKIKYVKGPHIAVLNILYSANGYKVEMDKETNLVYPKGMVDNKLNQWIRNVDKDISNEIKLMHHF